MWWVDPEASVLTKPPEPFPVRTMDWDGTPLENLNSLKLNPQIKPQNVISWKEIATAPRPLKMWSQPTGNSVLPISSNKSW